MNPLGNYGTLYEINGIPKEINGIPQEIHGILAENLWNPTGNQWNSSIVEGIYKSIEEIIYFLKGFIGSLRISMNSLWISQIFN